MSILHIGMLMQHALFIWLPVFDVDFCLLFCFCIDQQPLSSPLHQMQFSSSLLSDAARVGMVVIANVTSNSVQIASISINLSETTYCNELWILFEGHLQAISNNLSWMIMARKQMI